MGPQTRAPFNWGDFLHLVQILLLVATLGTYYQQFRDAQQQLQSLSLTVQRVERYLSSHDRHYWDNLPNQ